jgi:hypothetical protein
MANKERGEVTLELGGEKCVLRPEFGVIAEIEDELDTDMFRFGMKAEQFKFRVKELAHALKIVLEANGYEAEEKRLAKAIAKEGMAAVVLPLVAFVHAYVWGARREKKDSDPAPEAGVETGEAASSPPTSSPNA